MSTPDSLHKVLVYRSALLPYSETFVKQQIQACERWDPLLVGQRHLDELDLSGLDIVMEPSGQSGLFNRALRKLMRTPAPLLKFYRQLHGKLVHVHFGTDAAARWPLFEQLETPVIVTLHGYDICTYRDWWEAGNRGDFMATYPERLIEMTDSSQVRCVAVSEAIRQRAIEFGISPERIEVAYIGIDTAQFIPGEIPITKRRKRIAFVGRLVEKKGAAILLEAFKTVQRHVSNAELVIIGDGPLRDELQAYTRKHDLAVTFAGVMTAEEIRAHLHESRVLCLPSVTAANGDAEGFGLVLLEAQACGVPVVTSAHGGATEGIEHGKTGFAFPERDVATLAQYLEVLLTDDVLLDEMSHAAPTFVRENFDLRRCTRSLEAIYDRACAR